MTALSEARILDFAWCILWDCGVAMCKATVYLTVESFKHVVE